MPFKLKHELFSKNFIPTRHPPIAITPDKESGGSMTFKVDLEGEFPVLFPGRLFHAESATFTHRVNFETGGSTSPVTPPPPPLGGGGGGVPPPDDGPPRPPGPPGVDVTIKAIKLTLRIFTPDGREFTGRTVTLAHLRKFRDRRGGPSAPWKYKLTGESDRILVSKNSIVSDPQGSASLSLIETISSESAPPLVDNAAITRAPRSFTFDLFRVGTFVAEIRSAFGRWQGSMRLLDPDGVEVAQTTKRRLDFVVGLPTLGKSRDAAGRVRKWTLEVSRRGALLGVPRVNATVIERGKITIGALTSRIEALLGPNGRFIEIFGEDKDEHALVRLRIKDVVSAESIDMHNLLDDVLLKTQQDEGVRVSLVNDGVQANVVYTLVRKPAAQDFHMKLKVGSFKVKTIDLEIGPGAKLGAAVPTIKLTVAVSGKAKIKLGAATIADIEVPNDKIKIEIGINLSADGTPQFVTSVPDTMFDGDVQPGAAAVLAAASPVFGGLGALGINQKVDNIVEDEFNDPLVKAIRDTFADPTLAPRILMTIFGAHLTYEKIGFPPNSSDEIVFDYIAPLEPDPRPTRGYIGAIGRLVQTTGNGVTFDPPQLGDTWSAPNLTAKIDHIVVVMMENRSYDHVLGYRAKLPLSEDGNGLDEDMIKAIEAALGGSFKVRNLGEEREEGTFALNSLGFRTRLPKGVGHAFRDVQQQLSAQTAGPPGIDPINSPKGFVDNFEPRLRLAPTEEPHNVVPNDVLGFYDGDELPFFDYLAQNYAYCDRFYSSHPGPTLPNRMYSLTGDLQHDRYGFPIIDNNDGDNFLLSRAPTIYDLIVRLGLDRGLDFRVYESFPSVTMLRMFARYATDTVNIVSLGDEDDKFANLKADLAPGGRGLPAFTAIEPQMHAHPEDDDHPPADMHRGQVFLKEVYKALTSNPAVWERTLLIITYDEHGGLYDHVVPRVADVYTSGGLIANPHLTTSLTATLAGSASRTPPPPPPPPRRRGSLALNPKVIGQLANLPQLTQLPPPPLLIPYGVRVPTFIVSPWATRGNGPILEPDQRFDFCSILKTVLACFFGAEKPFLSDRVHASHSLDAFLTEARPRMNVPAFDENRLRGELQREERKRLSPTSKILTNPLSRGAMRSGPVDYHELSGRWARQLGR